MAETLLNLALALAVGLIVGLERGWHERTATEGSRVAGIRTFGLIGLMGGVWQLLSGGENPVLFGFGYLALAVLMGLAHFAESPVSHDYGITTEVAALITFLLGAISVKGEHALAATGAVVVAVLLSLKPALHGWLQRIEAVEINAALKLLLISVVVLPALPNKDFGPWGVLNPYAIWWLVVLMSAISFVAYIAVKIAGPKRGVLLSGMLGGLVSSTGVTLQLSRVAKNSEHKGLLASGILVASAVMFLRMLLVATILNRGLSSQMKWPLLVMPIPLFVAAIVFASRDSSDAVGELRLRNPMELGKTVKFGVLLSGILLASKAMQVWWGDTGLYLMAGTAGLADVDAIVISLARSTLTEGSLTSAANAAILAAMVNTITKSVLATSIGGRSFGFRVVIPVVLALAGGGLALWLL